jgi:tetratricopeptide (TPR) repeat protein
MVLGRWRFPAAITGLRPEDRRVHLQIDVEEGGPWRMNYPLTFDPAAPAIPSFATGHLLLWRTGLHEAQLYLKPASGRLTTEDFKRAIPELEAMVQRDPFSPWLRVFLGWARRETGDSRAAQDFAQALRIESSHYSEWLMIAAHFDRLSEWELGRAFFERGYRNFWEQDKDPRLLFIHIARLVLYRPFDDQRPGMSYPPEIHREIVERIYRLQPDTESADLAWELHARHLERTGRAGEANTWRERARDAVSWWSPGRGLYRPLNASALALPSCWLAAWTMVGVLYFRYRPQRRIHDAASARAPGPRPFRFLNLPYWSRKERAVFLTLMIAAWFATGIYKVYGQGVLRGWAMTTGLGVGGLDTPVAPKWFEEHRDSPERNLFLAWAYLKNGDPAKAESLYRALPFWAEAWNNLGVVEKQRGRAAEARQCFEKALEIKPDLAEAALNLGRPPASLWTEAHRRYRGEQPMLAPPPAHLWTRVLLGYSHPEAHARALLGPFAGKFSIIAAVAQDITEGQPIPEPIVLSLGLAAALAILWLVPHRDVTQPAGPRHWILEALFPGVATAWGFCGALVLAVWWFLILRCVLVVTTGVPLLWAMIPDLVGFGVTSDDREAFSLLRPEWWSLYLVPALLWAANLGLVLRRRRA